MSNEFSPLWVSLKVSVTAAFITFMLGVAAAWIVGRLKRGRSTADVLLSLPMVLPPTVVGFFLLMFFGKDGFLGKLLADMGKSVLFTWQGAVIAAVAVSFPIMYRTVRGAFDQIDKNITDAARTLGLSESRIFFKIMIPMARPGIAAAALLSFARALGEFGATMMIAGNIPGKTQTIPIAVYTAIQGGNREAAYVWVFIIMAISFTIIFLMNIWNERMYKRSGLRR